MTDIVSVIQGAERVVSDESLSLVTQSLRAAAKDFERVWLTHPLGFFYCADDLGGGVKLRYHYWPIGWKLPENQIHSEFHDHIFDLKSIM